MRTNPISPRAPRLCIFTISAALILMLAACGIDERLERSYELCSESHSNEPSFEADCKKFWEEFLSCAFDRDIKLSIRKYTDYCETRAGGRANNYYARLAALGNASRIQRERQVCADYDLTWTPQGCE